MLRVTQGMSIAVNANLNVLSKVGVKIWVSVAPWFCSLFLDKEEKPAWMACVTGSRIGRMLLSQDRTQPGLPERLRYERDSPLAAKVMRKGETDVGLQRHAHDALERRRSGGQGQCLQSLSGVAAGGEEVHAQTVAAPFAK